MINNILIKFLAVFLCFCFFFSNLIANAKTTIKGDIIAGGIILVNTFPGASARLDGNDILVSDQGIL